MPPGADETGNLEVRRYGAPFAIGGLEPGVLLHWTAWTNLVDGGFIRSLPVFVAPLLAALADPITRPQRVEPGVDNEHGVASGEIAHCTRNSLRMNPILAARAHVVEQRLGQVLG